MTLRLFVTARADVWRKETAVGTVALTPPMPLEAQLAQSYPAIRQVSRAYEALGNDPDADVREGDVVVYQGDTREFVVVAVERWYQALPHIRLVLEERG